MKQDLKNVEGLVLRAYNIKDSSRIVDLLARDQGRISFMARGARRDKSPSLNLTQPYVEGRYNLQPGRFMYYFKDGQIQNAHLGLRKSIRRLALTEFSVEALTSVVFTEGDPILYDFMVTYLGIVEEAGESDLARLLGAYLFKLVSLVGFRPSLGSCLECGGGVKLPLVFDLHGGGMVCDDHPGRPGQRTLSMDQYQELVAYLTQPFREIREGSREEKGELYRTTARLCLAYFQIQTGRDRFKSLAMLQDLGLV